MTCEPHKAPFTNAFPLATLVLVDMKRSSLASAMGLGRADIAGILSNCRSALAYARKIGWPVAFVCGSGDTAADRVNEWIKGFEPQRSDALFYRHSGSCYSSPYFEQGMQEAGSSVVFAGFLGRGGCLSTGADAFLVGQRVTFLSDATLDEATSYALGESAARLLRAFTTFDIDIVTTGAWIRTIERAPIAINN